MCGGSCLGTVSRGFQAPPPLLGVRIALVALLGVPHASEMSAFVWDEDLLSFPPDEENASAGPDDFEDRADQDSAIDGEEPGRAGSGASSKDDSVETLGTSSVPRRRKRGARGGAGSRTGSHGAGAEKRWRSGAVPTAPAFDGNVEADPFCLRHYKRRLRRWTRITREYLPPNEQALRALEQLRGEAEIELEETDDSRYDCANGIDLLLKDLEVSFGEREIFRQGGTIREFESIGRLQGETVNAFVRRFRLLERKLMDNKVAPYPEQARVIKLLDGLRLDEKATAALLLAAGNKYDMGRVEAIRIQYPAGMSITGVPRGKPDFRKPKGRGFASLSSTSSSRSASTARSSASRSTRGWKQWNTSWDEDAAEDYDYDEGYQAGDYVFESIPEDVDEDHQQVEDHGGTAANAEDFEDYVEDESQEFNGGETGEDWEQDDTQALLAAAQALTVTSRKLAGLAQARGYYQTEGKSNGKNAGKAKGKGKGGSKGKTPKGQGKGKSKSKSSGKGKTRTDASSTLQQQRLKGSLCLGCGSPDHWLKDCPSYSVQNAQLTSASYTSLTLDAEGTIASWMVYAQGEKKDEAAYYELPELAAEDRLALAQDFVQMYDYVHATDKISRTPHVLLQYHASTNSAYMIADTGCPRQVADKRGTIKRSRKSNPFCARRFRTTADSPLGLGRGSQVKVDTPIQLRLRGCL